MDISVSASTLDLLKSLEINFETLTVWCISQALVKAGDIFRKSGETDNYLSLLIPGESKKSFGVWKGVE